MVQCILKTKQTQTQNKTNIKTKHKTKQTRNKTNITMNS